MLNAYLTKVTDWVKKNRLESILIATVLLVSAFLRLYRIDEYMTFLGDEGRDVLIVRRLLVDADPILIGPGTSIGNMYLGPIYYYLMAPFLLLANFSPVGPAVMIALLGIITVWFVWFTVRKWFPRKAVNWGAVIAALLYGISPIVIIYSRSSWNPNIMPFFALLTIYSIWKWWREKEFKWIVITGLAMGFVLQSHYLGLLLVPVIGTFWLFTFIANRNAKQKNRSFWKNSALGLLLFLFLMSPLAIFDARHGWQNFSAMKKFFLERQTTVSARPWNALPNIPSIYFKAVTRLIGGTNEALGQWIGVLLAIGVLLVVIKLITAIKSRRELSGSSSGYLILALWLGFAFLGLGLYKQEIYDHYYGFFFAAFFILLGGLINSIFNSIRKRNILIKYSVTLSLFIFVVIIAVVNLADNPLQYAPNRQLQRTEEVARKISTESSDQKFNLAVIAERNYEDAYQYFLERWGTKVIEIDPENTDETIADQLFVVCELEDKQKCDPTHNPKAQVANFGWSEIANAWDIAGVVLYQLVHPTNL
jgi:4-amino-4-deoxy-L-arabinose transferase-like glycosyltransferase